VSCAAAVDRIRGLIADVMPPELHTVTVCVGHPGSTEEYELAVSLYVLHIRQDPGHSSHPGEERPSVLEAQLLIAAHAPPERGTDAILMLELAIGVVRATPHLGQVAPHATAEVLLQPVTIGELATIWQGLEAPLQPSVMCNLRVVVSPAPRP
jgi:hypothetical protein